MASRSLFQCFLSCFGNIFTPLWQWSCKTLRIWGSNKKSTEVKRGTLDNASITKWREDLKTGQAEGQDLPRILCPQCWLQPRHNSGFVGKCWSPETYQWWLSISLLNPYQKTTVHRVSKYRVWANAANLPTLL